MVTDPVSPVWTENTGTDLCFKIQANFFTLEGRRTLVSTAFLFCPIVVCVIYKLLMTSR
ncbi:MAG: hypothetical protein JWO50_27 [Candidatus Kaiserbacteria bacterium]|nr:hypothetical protein [Candidatus Kaiserbacteria bacterium]